tara:strand:- start:204 stop:539 length:336 start_codon:yes stop_codon:yes gene_type:complete
MKVEMNPLTLGLIPGLEQAFQDSLDDVKRTYGEAGRYALNKGVLQAEINIRVGLSFAPDTGVALMEVTCTPKLPKVAGVKRALDFRGGDLQITEDDNSEQTTLTFPQRVEE